MLERQCHEHSLFSTFTYAEPPLTPDGRPTVHKPDFQKFMHRLRKSLADQGRTVRFYAVGEYGERTQRPHYHAALFGCSLSDASLVDGAWRGERDMGDHGKRGLTHHGLLTEQSAQYLCGYVTKKLTKATDPRLLGRAPEFALSSRKPGIGSGFVVGICEAMNTSLGAAYIAANGDVPSSFSFGTRVLPLGTFIRHKLRLYFFGSTLQPQAAKDIARERHLQHLSTLLPPLPLDASTYDQVKAWSQAQAVHDDQVETKRRVRSLQTATRHAINKARRSI